MGTTKADTLWVRQMRLGPMKNFVYLAGSAGSRQAFVIDPAWDVKAIFAQLEADERRLEAVVLTHSHHDHLNGVPDILKRIDVPVYVQRDEGLREFGDARREVEPGAVLKLAGTEVKCIHTPGHTPGSQCFFCGGALFSGDTLFVNACGRCDFPGSDPRQMHDSLFKVLGTLDGETKLYAGHDYGDVAVSSLARERERNPYFRLHDVEDFVRFRMRPRT